MMHSKSFFVKIANRLEVGGQLKTISILGVLLIALFVTGNSFATCPPDTGIADVHVAFVDLDDNGIPDINSSSKERNEHARISSSLAGKLNITLPNNPDFYPQIRVITQNQNLANGHPGTGIFSVSAIFTSTTDEIEIWVDEDSGDEDSGEYRLFENVTITDLTAVRVTAFAQAPSSTEVTREGSSTLTEHFCEPHPASTLTEAVVIEDDKRFALLVPHGGEVESETSEQISPIVQGLDSWGVDANTWDLQGFWHGNTDESEHWHITSKEVSHTNGLPGLLELSAEPNYDATRDFQYVASLHGMKFSKEGMVIGGRANREAKCLIASRVRERLAAESLTLPAVFIWNYDEDLNEKVEVAHGDGVTTITGERGSDPGLSGTDESNIVNRLSPNADGAPGFGGFQIEQSPRLRDDGYRDFVAAEIANAFGELLTKPGIINANGTAICDALVAGTPAPTGEIRGRVWRDGGEGSQSAGEPGVAGVSIDLLDMSSNVLETTLTDAAGTYAFSGLDAGTYRVRVNVSSVFGFAAQDQAGGDDSLDSDVDTAGLSGTLVLAAHALKPDVDAGLVLATGSASLGDFTWDDSQNNGIQANGIQDSGEPALDDVRVELLDVDGVLIDEDITSGGFYAFSGLPLGSYVLRFTPPLGFEPAAFQQGGDSSRDSDLDANFEIAVTVSSPGSTDLDLDAGFVLNCLDATLVAFGSEWTRSTTFDSSWTEVDFPEVGWEDEKQASLGYGTAVETSITDVGSVTYFRLAFELEDPTLFDALDLQLLRSDGAIVYLNDQQVLSSNVPITTTGLATESVTLQQPSLLTGTNVLAVEVHESSGVLAFDLELSARICRPCVESKRLPASRVAYMRQNSSKNRGGELVAQMDADTPESGLFAFATSELPQDAEVLHAAIEWRVTDGSINPFHFYPLLVDWDEATVDWFHASDPANVDWNTPGALDESLDHDRSEPLATFVFEDKPGQSSYTGLVLLNVGGRKLVQAWARGEQGNYGVLVPGEGPDDHKLVVDSNEGQQPPVLEVVYRSCGN